MTDGNLFPELSAETEPEKDPDAIGLDPNNTATTSEPEPLPTPIPSPAEPAPSPNPETLTQIPQDSTQPPSQAPEPPMVLTAAPAGKRGGSFWYWAAPALLLILILLGVVVRAFMMRGIANISLDVVRPRSGETIFLNQPVTVVARVRSSNGWSRANFYVNNQIIQSIPGMDANFDQELNFTWTPSAEGPTMLRVLVTNKKGDQTAAEDVAVLVSGIQSGVTFTPIPINSPTITLTPTKGPSPTPCTDLFEIISESGLTMGTQLDVARPFSKSWTLKNVGSCTWDQYKFVFASGSLLGATTPISVPVTETGGTATLNLSLTSPSIAGSFIGKWRVQNAKGDLFGAELVYGLVIPSPTPTITPTKTDTPTPRPTNTPRPTYTPRPTFTPRFSVTPSVTRTSTPTNTATITATATQTVTPTSTPTETPTETATQTPTPTDWVIITVEMFDSLGTPYFVTQIATWTPTPTPTETPAP